MVTAITPEPPIYSGAHMADYRNRLAPGERPMLADSTPAAPKNAGANNNSRPNTQSQQPDLPEQPVRDSSSMFAAAVIAGALPPTPQTMEQLMLRIGISPIPEESQARLKDLLA